MTEKIIRASDIGLYVFCARAWRLKAEGYESRNLAEMTAGAEAHQAHGARVVAYHRLRAASIALFAASLALLLLWALTR